MHIMHFLQGIVHFLKFTARVRARVKCILCTSYKVRSIFLKFMARVRVRVKCILCTFYKVSSIF